MAGLDKFVKEFARLLKQQDKRKTSAYDTTAKVKRIDGDVAWVHIAGGVDETPVKLTVNAEVGDSVQVRVSGGRAWITGNSTNPPTDDKRAIKAHNVALSADNVAKQAKMQADLATELANNAQESADENAEAMAEAVLQINSDIEDLQSQIDGNITSWFYTSDPSMSSPPVTVDPLNPDATGWDTDEKKQNHVGDLYYNTTSGYVWRFVFQSGSYQWLRVTDSDVTRALQDAAKAQDTADSKRRVFYTTPTPPYDAGDLWVQGSGGDILRCSQARPETGSYSQNDWVLASKYTDNSVFQTWLDNDFAETIEELEEGITDAKIETYYQTNDPSSGWSATEKQQHTGDMWYNSTASVQKYYRWSGSAWTECKATPPQTVFDEINGKANIFVGSTTPTGANAGDLWFKGTGEPILTYVNNSWVEYNKYTDNTRANAAYSLAESAERKANATKQYFWHDDSGVHVASEADTPAATRNSIWTDVGMIFRKGVNYLLVLKTGNSPGVDVYDGAGAADANRIASFGATTIIGKVARGFSRTQIFGGGMKIFRRDNDSDTDIELANIGYGLGKAQGGGEDTAPYYTFGIRRDSTTPYSSSRTYNIGAVCVYDDNVYVCISDITTPEAWNANHWQLAHGTYSFTEGVYTLASGYCSHAEGSMSRSMGDSSHVEGSGSYAIGTSSHAEGYGTNANEEHSHAEGTGTNANGKSSHAEGSGTTAGGSMSHAEGDGSMASGHHSHAQNKGTISHGMAQTVIGTFNVEDTTPNTPVHPSGEADYDNYAFIIGNGTDYDSRSNAFTVDWNGAVEFGDPANTFVVTQETLFSATMSAGNVQSTPQTFTKAGYYPIGVVGWETNSGDINAANLEISARNNGSATVSYIFKNVGSASRTVTAKVDILWIKYA